MTTTAPDTRGLANLSRRQTNIVFVTILLGMLLAALDQTIVSTALPTIVADLGGSQHMSWVVTAYLLAETISTVLAGKFGDMFGRKPVFQLSAIIFVGGSVVAGMAHGMTLLIAARAVQGIGGGGLMVTAMALIADVIPLRERGKYQGALGAVFGVTTVLGPTLGGLFTDHASWRWCFYVNVPIAVIMVAMAARTIPTVKAATRPSIDYLGLALVALGAAGLILGLEWGGNEYPWGSGVIIGLFVGAVALLAAFVWVELRAAEPILPMSLFRSRTFTVCAVLSFIVGFAMLGAMTFLPTYLQYVDGVSATVSGLRTIPMVIGLLAASLLSGNVVSATGRYRIFPIVGTAVMAVGLLLMSTMHRGTGIWLESLYMLVLGTGLGLSMQVLTIAVQNTVPYAQLGTATSGVTFFRTLGSSFGTAVFGTLYTTRLRHGLTDAFAAHPHIPPAAATSPTLLHRLPAATGIPVIDAYGSAIDYVFRWVVPVAVVGFGVAWLLKEVPLHDSARAAATDVGEGFSVPDSADCTAQLERAVANVLRRQRPPLETLMAEADSTLTPDLLWVIGETHWRTRIHGRAMIEEIAFGHHLPPQVLQPAFDKAAAAGYVTIDDHRLELTAAGRSENERVASAWRRWLDNRLPGWSLTDPADRDRLELALDNIARRLLDHEHTVAIAPKVVA